MKLLLSSIACQPFGASEGIYGWRACRAIAALHEVWVLTEAGNREQIEKARGLGMVPDTMHFVYVGKVPEWHSNRLIARLQSWARYRRFQKQSLEIARELHEEIGFDAAQLVTYTTWRVGCPLWKLGIPFIWGPISGTEMFPLRFLPYLSGSAKAFEFLRIVTGWISTCSASVRRCAQNAARVVAIHRQAAEKIAGLRGTSEGIPVFPAFFFDDDHIAALIQPRPYNLGDAPLKLIAAGNLEGRKGVALALHALRKVADAGVPFSYRVTSKGPELEHLRKLARELGLEDKVSLGDAFPHGEYTQRLREFDVCLLPSLREGGGLTMMESMLAGCVPIVADCGGPGDTVTKECGFPIPVTTPDEMIDRMAETVLKLHRERHLLQELGDKARTRLLNRGTEAAFKHELSKIYQELS